MALQCRRLQSREKEPSNFFSLLHPRHLFISFAFLTFERAAFPMAVCVCALLLFLFFQCPTGWTDWKTGHQPHRQKRWRKRRRNSQTPILLYTGVNKSAVNRRRRRLTQRKEFPFYWEVVEDGRAGATHSIFGWYLLQIRPFLPRRRRDRLHFVAVVRTNCACHVCLFSSYDIPNDRLWLDRSWRCQTEGKKKRRTAREFRSVSPLL